MNAMARQRVLMQAARCLNTLVTFQHVQSSALEHLSTCHLSLAAAAAAPQPAWGTYNPAAAVNWTQNRTFFSQFTQPDSKVYKERRLIGYSPEQLYAVVANVQHYHQFVPWCVGSQVLKQAPDGTYLEAELQIGFQMISERYTSKVKLQAPHLVSSTVADSALFHHLESVWQLKPGPSPNSTWLSFSVDFAFLNPLYANVAQLFFSEVVTRMMGAFEGRCKHLYGPPSFSPAGQQQQQQNRHAGLKQQQQLQQHRHRLQPAAPAAGSQQPPLLQHVPAGTAAGANSSAGAAVQQPGSQQIAHQRGWHED